MRAENRVAKKAGIGLFLAAIVLMGTMCDLAYFFEVEDMVIMGVGLAAVAGLGICALKGYHV